MVTACLCAIAAVGIERLFELHLSRRNAAWSFARGGIEFGQGHLLPMKLLHTALLLGCVVETYVTGGLYHPVLTPLCIAAAACSQVLRYTCITTLGPRWNIRVIVVPGLAPVALGPYRYLSHPNYVAVVLEGLALPLCFGAWVTALSFTVLNAWLLRTRIGCENRALAEVCRAGTLAAAAKAHP